MDNPVTMKMTVVLPGRLPARIYWPERWRVDYLNTLTGERLETVAWFVTEHQARAYIHAVCCDWLNWKMEFSITLEKWEKVK